MDTTTRNPLLGAIARGIPAEEIARRSVVSMAKREELLDEAIRQWQAFDEALFAEPWD